MRKSLKKIILIISIMILLLSTAVYASNLENKQIVIEKSEEFSKWEKLSDEEKKYAIQPAYFTTNIKESIKRSTYNNYLKATGTEENTYSLRDEITNINVKNQKKTGSCWAFSYTSIIETTLAHKYQRQINAYSPLHIDYVSAKSYNKKVGEGGTMLMALAYSASGKGPVYESDFPFENVYDETQNSESEYYLSDINSVETNQAPRDRITDMTKFPSIYKSYSSDEITYKDSEAIIGGNRYTTEEVQAIRELVKKHIKENGGVVATFYSDMGTTQQDEYVSRNGYYNSETKAFYTDSYLHNANHAVTIVGWDDTFEKENFSEGKQPLNDGAYIVLNSWGTEFGDNGYFYVSYDDAFIEQELYGITEITEQKNYDNMYEYDELGMNHGIYSLNDNHTEYLTSGYGANIFTRNDTEKIEYLSEVGIFLTNTEGIEIYVNAAGDDLNNCILVGAYTGTNALGAGYHTLKLSSPVQLTGNKFVVKIKYINSEKVVVPLECNILDSGMTTESNVYDKATSNAGESFFSNDGSTWHDLDGFVLDEYTLKNTSICIKAFTTLSGGENSETVLVTGIELEKTELTIKEGENATLQATILPENATNKKVLWESKDENVATVSNGIVTGVAEGTTKIIATTEDGKFSKTCTVTVEKENGETTIATTGIQLDKQTLKINVGETSNLTATVLPENATNKKVLWESENTSIAKVENGQITGLAVGTTEITATTEDGNFKDKCEVTVEEQKESTNVSVTGIKLDKTTLSMQEGDKANLVATIQPTNATNKNVKWTSSNETVATISETGIIEALKEGKTTITVTSIDGQFKASCELIVTKKINVADDIYTEKEQNSGDIQNNQGADTTIANKDLPKAGIEVITIIAIVAISGVIIIYKKYKKYEDIK